jgi:hypothetical protein
MRRLLLFLLLIAVSFGSIAVPFGNDLSADTLIPSPTPSTTSASTHYELPQRDAIIQDHDPIETAIDDIDDIDEDSQPDPASFVKSAKRFKMDDHFHSKNGDDWGLYVPIDVGSETTVVRRSVGVEKRGTSKGTVQMDCLSAPEVCKNAGWYQNCLNGAKGDPSKVQYTNGPTQEENPSADKRNRFNSCVSTTFTTPCRTWPICQRTWHPKAALMALPLEPSGLQTDEWPMASMENEDFEPTSAIPQVSLRCMDHKENLHGSNQVMAFRRCWPDYQVGGKFDSERDKGSTGICAPLAVGDTYSVAFNFDRFDPTNQTQNEIRS